MRVRRALPWLLACTLLGSCAWTRRENRPVWNAFEQNLVPGSEAAFVATLPLTVPVGLCAILVDTFVAHPLQVVDDAADDAADLWRQRDWENHYYTEAGFAPLRAIGTPIVFLGSFLGRSTFDVRSTEQAERDRDAARKKQRSTTLAWLAAIARGGDDRLSGAAYEPWDEELAAALAAAFAGATAPGRLRIYEQAAGQDSFAARVDWSAGLTDPSAVVRYRVLTMLKKSVVVPEAVIAALRADADEVVRSAAAKRWP